MYVRAIYVYMYVCMKYMCVYTCVCVRVHKLMNIYIYADTKPYSEMSIGGCDAPPPPTYAYIRAYMCVFSISLDSMLGLNGAFYT